MSNKNTSRTYKDKAKAAADKPAALGEDIDLKDYVSSGEEHKYQADPSQLPAKAKGQMLDAGVMLDDASQRSGTYIQMDNMPVHSSISQDGVEVMAVSQAMEKYDWFADYWWQAVAVDTDKYTANIELNENDGYFIRSLPGQKTVFPVQACLYLAAAKLMQNVHNIIIAEEDSELHIITGCTTASREDPGLHLGVSEFYIKRGAKVTFTMIHSWNPETSVRPRTAAIVEEDGEGFTRSESKYWYESSAGHNGRSLWTYTMRTKEDCWAEWRPDLPETGLYEVLAFIPRINATSKQARYQITHRRGVDVAIVDQSRYFDEWASLGRYPCSISPTMPTIIRLSDQTGEPFTRNKAGRKQLAFDAICFVRIQEA